jgi:hypothetical protein
MIKFTERPTKQATCIDAWDYVTATYGTPDLLMFTAPCGGPALWTAKVKGKMISINPTEIKGFVKNGKKFILNPQK